MRSAQVGDYEPRLGGLVHRLANIAGDVELGEGTRVDAFVTLTGRVWIGRFCHISTGVCVFGTEGVVIGDYSGLSAGVKVFTGTEDLSGEWMMNPTISARYRKSISQPVRIGAHCVVGAGSVLLPGAHLPDGACVGALSLVKSPASEWSIWAGVPARFIRARSRRALELQAAFEDDKD